MSDLLADAELRDLGGEQTTCHQFIGPFRKDATGEREKKEGNRTLGHPGVEPG